MEPLPDFLPTTCYDIRSFCVAEVQNAVLKMRCGRDADVRSEKILDDGARSMHATLRCVSRPGILFQHPCDTPFTAYNFLEYSGIVQQ